MMRPDVYHAGYLEHDHERVTWIITTSLSVVRVRATYRSKFKRWYYQDLRKGQQVVECYYPTLTGNRSYWGDGLHYRTRKCARKALVPILKREAGEARKHYNSYRDRAVDSLRKKAEDAGIRGVKL